MTMGQLLWYRLCRWQATHPLLLLLLPWGQLPCLQQGRQQLEHSTLLLLPFTLLRPSHLVPDHRSWGQRHPQQTLRSPRQVQCYPRQGCHKAQATQRLNPRPNQAGPRQASANPWDHQTSLHSCHKQAPGHRHRACLTTGTGKPTSS